MMMQTLERQPVWAVWSGCAALSVVLTAVSYLYVVQPGQAQQHAADTVAATVRQQQSDIASLEEKQAGLQRIHEEKLTTLREQPSTLGNARELNRRLAMLIELAQSQGLEVLQLQPGESLPGEHYDMILLRLEAEASFPEHLEFLETLHGAFPDLSVVGLDLRSELRSAAPRPRAVVNLVWFTQTQATAISSVDPANDR